MSLAVSLSLLPAPQFPCAYVLFIPYAKPMPIQPVDLAKAFRPLKPQQREAIKSYVECVVLNAMYIKTWIKTVDKAPSADAWYAWRTQEKFNRAFTLYVESMEERRLEADMRRAAEIAQYEAQARYIMAKAKPVAATRLSGIAEEGGEREAVNASKVILDYKTREDATSSPDSDLWRQAGEPVEQPPVEPAGEAPDDGSPSSD